MEEEVKLTRFEQELIRHLRALPFSVQQHVSRQILKLQREHATVPQDPTAAKDLGEAGPPIWNMTRDELNKMREEMGMEDDDEKK